MSLLQFPSCDTCKKARYEVSFPTAAGDRKKLCGPCLGAIYTIWATARLAFLSEDALRSVTPSDQDG